jgi:hypothetical protein
MLVEISDKEMAFQAVTRTGRTVDRGTIVQQEGGQTTISPAAPAATPAKR